MKQSDSPFSPIDFMQCLELSHSIGIDEEDPNNIHFNLDLPHQTYKHKDDLKKSYKNKYKNKIKNSVPESSTDHKRAKPSEGGDYDKKERNKVAAKESRDRKRIYIELVEQEIKDLEEEVKNTNKEVDDCKVEIQKATFSNNQYIGQLASKLSHVFKKLQRLLESQNSQERNNELNLSIDSILYRCGATGKERKFNITESYKQIFNLSIPSLHRYLLWAAAQRVHLFAEGNQQDDSQKWFQDLSDQLNFQEVFKTSGRQFFIQKGDQLRTQRSLLVQLVVNLVKGKEELEKQGLDLDNLFLQFREILTPMQATQFILFIDKYKYRDQLRSEQEEKVDFLRKIVKSE